MRFVIYGRFEADGIDDAFARLAAHFDGLTEGAREEQEYEPVLGGSYQLVVRPADSGGETVLRHDDA